MAVKTPVDRGVMVIHSGVQHSYQTALAMQEAGLLQKYITGFYYKDSGLLSRLINRLPSGNGMRWKQELSKRNMPGLDPHRITSFMLRDLINSAFSKIKFFEKAVKRFGPYHDYVDYFQKKAAAMVLRNSPSAVICYDTCCIKVFEAAEKVGAVRVLDQTIGHLTSAIKVFRECGVPYDLPEFLLERSIQEIKMADHILAGSEYVRNTLLSADVDADKITVLPYGVDTDQFKPSQKIRSEDFRILFVGRVNHRKGIQYLFDAFDRLDLPNLKLLLVGPIWGGTKWLEPYKGRVFYSSQLPHNQIHEVFQKADIFIFPSIHEGSSLTIYEALASGLPVITTPNAGSVITDGQEGFIVPVGDVNSLVDKITVLYHDQALRETMSRKARECAERFTWSRYRQRLGQLVGEWIKK